MNIIEEIRNKINILDIISTTVALKKHGNEYLGRCPFHAEKSASFFVNPKKGVYYCFGCGVKGNVFDFYMQINNTTFAQTLEIFATKLNITLPKDSGVNKETTDKKQKLMNALNLAKNYFKDQLYLKVGENALNYLKARGLDEQTIQNFDLGFCKENNNELFEILNSNGVFEEDLLEIGLKSYNSTGIIYEPFKLRIMFPIKNIKGEVIAFGGRALNNDVMPKYLNSKESLVFSKKNTLYGINLANKNLKDNKNLIIVEGYMDVITLHKQGFNTAVATLGTAISKVHLDNITSYSKEPIFVLDGDTAGKKATERAINEYLPILKSGLNPKFVFLQEKDPDSFFENKTKDNFNEVLKQAEGISKTLLNLEILNKNIALPEIYASVLQNLTFKIQEIPDVFLKKEILAFFKNELFNIKIKNRQNVNNANQNNRKHLQNNNFVLSYTQDLKLGLDLTLDLRRALEILYCIYKFPEVLLDIEEQLAVVVFKNTHLENIKNCLLENVNDIIYILNDKENNNKQDVIKTVLLKHNLHNDYNFFMPYIVDIQDKIKEKYDITNKKEALNWFLNTYNLLKLEVLSLEQNKIDDQIKALHSKMISLNEEVAKQETYNLILRLLKQKEEIKKDIKNINNFVNY